MTALAKSAARALALLLVSPLLLLDLLLRGTGSHALFAAMTQLLSLVPGRTGSYLRLAYLRVVLPDCHPDSFVGFGTLFSQRDTRLGRGIYVGPQCNIGRCAIGDDTLVASGVHIMSGTGQHNFDDLNTPIRDQGGEYRQIRIGRDCWIGNGALIMADVGDQSVIGAGSVVTEAIPPRSIAVGNPARVIRRRDESDPVTDSATTAASP